MNRGSDVSAESGPHPAVLARVIAGNIETLAGFGVITRKEMASSHCQCVRYHMDLGDDLLFFAVRQRLDNGVSCFGFTRFDNPHVDI
jgi:hypothetical protein